MFVFILSYDIKKNYEYKTKKMAVKALQYIISI